MTAESFTAGRFASQNQKVEPSQPTFDKRGISVTEGTRPQSRSRAVSGPVLDQTPQGSIHRDTVQQFVPHDVSHEPYSSIHRPEEPQDIQALKAHQSAMLTRRARQKRKEK